MQHGPWMPWESLPQDTQPQDGAFNHTSLGEGQIPYYRPMGRQDSSSSEDMPALVPFSDSDQDSVLAEARYIETPGNQRVVGTLGGTLL